MLRDPKRAVDRSGPLVKVVSVAGLLMLGLAVSGIRPGIVEAQTSPEAQVTASDPPNDQTVRHEKAADTESALSPAAYIPSNATFVVMCRPQEILDNPKIKPHTDELEKMFASAPILPWDTFHEAGIKLQNIEATAAGGTMPGYWGGWTAIVTLPDHPIDRSVIEQAATETKAVSDDVMHRIRTTNKNVTWEDGEAVAVFEINADTYIIIPDNHTLLFSSNEAMVTAMLIHGNAGRGEESWTGMDDRLGSPSVAVLVNSDNLQSSLERLRLANPGEAERFETPLTFLQPLLIDANLVGVGLALGQGPDIVGYVESNDQAGAARVAETLQALVTLGKNSLRQMHVEASKRSEGDPALPPTVPILEQLLESVEITTDKSHVRLTATSDEASALIGLLLPALHQTHRATQLDQSKRNLKQIAIAFHNYHDVYGFFPPAVIEENGVKRSWRVEILPFVEAGTLYDKYRQDEPWNSEHNKKILAQMPDVFRDPLDDSEPYSTSYFLLTHEHAVTNSRTAHDKMKLLPGNKRVPNQLPVAEFVLSFTDNPIDIQAGERGPWMGDITDGTSPTIMVVGASRNVPWTKPEDIPIDPDKITELLEDLGGNHEGRFLAAMADISVRFFPKDIDPELLKKLITPSGGERINLDDIMPALQPKQPPQQRLLPPQQSNQQP